MLVIRLNLKPLLDALACVDEKSAVRIATTTPGRCMVKDVGNGTEITYELFCVEVVHETSSETSAVVGFQCQYEGTMYGINEMLETLRTVVDPYVTISFSQQDKDRCPQIQYGYGSDDQKGRHEDGRRKQLHQQTCLQSLRIL
jgi:hypothetical protein